MLETFEAYARHGEARQFFPLTCERAELIGQAKRLLESTEAMSVSVHHRGEHLFTLER